MKDIHYEYLNYILKLISIMIINIFIFINILLKNNQIKNTKVCLCTNGKKENLYVREYVEHYKNMVWIKSLFMIIMKLMVKNLKM